MFLVTGDFYTPILGHVLGGPLPPPLFQVFPFANHSCLQFFLATVKTISQIWMYEKRQTNET